MTAIESVLEQQRRLHEERERVMNTMVKESLHKNNTYREQVNADHRMKILLDRYMEASAKLYELYEDADGGRQQEVAAISGPNEFAEYYTRLNNMREYHKHHTDEVSVPMSIEFDAMVKQLEDPEHMEDMVDFTDEEGYGKYLDLHAHFEKYINLKGVTKIDYVAYLTVFDRLFEIPRESKNRDYKKYLEALLEYLADYIARLRPLLDQSEELTKAVDDFNKQWEAQTFPGWTKETASSSALSSAGAHLDLSPYEKPEDLMALGLDRLKSALIALGLKCGGTLEDRARRLFATKGKDLSAIDPSLKVKGSAKAKAGGVEASLEKQKELACVEAQFYHFVELEQRAATKENVERKQARTAADIRSEEEAELAASAAADVATAEIGDEMDNDDDIPYNPKNLPLGWDGKPIPYWLYKLHGLNISYPCEICGNQVYKGPKAFQRHFSEWRHSHGMRCLGIPNTAHFANVTKIADAVQLWSRLRVQKDDERFKPEFEEEFEDSMGNVVTRRIFEDLKRQGLL